MPTRTGTAARQRHGRATGASQASRISDQAYRLARASFETGQQLIDVRLIHRNGRMLRPVQQRRLGRLGCRRDRSAWRRHLLPNVVTIFATFASIAFSVATTLVIRWPVMSWKLHAS